MNRRYERYFEFIKKAAWTPTVKEKIIKEVGDALGIFDSMAGKSGKAYEEVLEKAKALADKGDAGAKLFVRRAQKAKSAEELKQFMDRDREIFEAAKVDEGIKIVDNKTTRKSMPLVSEDQAMAGKRAVQDAEERRKSIVSSAETALKKDLDTDLKTISDPKLVKQRQDVYDKAVEDLRLRSIRGANFNQEKNQFKTKEEAIDFLNARNQDDILKKFKKPEPSTGQQQTTGEKKRFIDEPSVEGFKEEAKGAWENYKKRWKEKPYSTAAYTAGGIGAAGGAGYLISGRNNNED